MSCTGATSVTAYFPKARWYDFFSRAVVSVSGGESKTLDTPLEKIQVHVRGGVIIPMQEPALTTAASRQNPYCLLVALDSSNMANGSVYLDDGISLDVTRSSLVSELMLSIVANYCCYDAVTLLLRIVQVRVQARQLCSHMWKAM